MKLVLGTNKYQGKPLNIIKGVLPSQFEFKMLDEQTEKCFIDTVEDADYILAGGRTKLTKAVLDNAQNLKMIQRSGVGLDSLDLDAIRAKGIPLYVNQGVNSQSVAEHTLMMILACMKKMPLINFKTKSGIWRKQEQGLQTFELKGKTVGVIGMGNIARTLVKLLKPFQVNILYNNLIQVEHDFETENNMRFVTLDELLQKSDVVTIHCALTSETRNLINAEAIKIMKDGSVLINTARGGIVDMHALVSALMSGKLAFAAIDVHEKEPIPNDYVLKQIENVILTPHIAGVSYDSFKKMMHDAFRNIELFDRGELEAIAQYRYL